VIVGGWVGGQISRRHGPKYVITVGLTFEALGIWLYFFAFSGSTSFRALLPALVLHGIGIGFATSQLTNVVLSDIPPQKAGSASGAAAMVRQVGTALGIALIGAIFVSQATSNVRHDLARETAIPATVKTQVIKAVSDGVGGAPPGVDPGTPVGRRVDALVSHGVVEASKPAVAFAGTVVVAGALLSLLVPNIPAEHGPPTSEVAAAPTASDADDEPTELLDPTPT
jgi:Major Facilitator Superfamily